EVASCRDGAADRSDQTRRSRTADSGEPGLRTMARADAGGVLHGAAGASTGWIRSTRLAAQRFVLPRHDHRLGCAPLRLGALGDGRRTLGTDPNRGTRGVSDQLDLERARRL